MLPLPFQHKRNINYFYWHMLLSPEELVLPLLEAPSNAQAGPKLSQHAYPPPVSQGLVLLHPDELVLPPEWGWTTLPLQQDLLHTMLLNMLFVYFPQGLVLLNPEELVLPPVKIPDDMAAHEKAAIRSLADLVTQCTAFSPDARPSVAEILQVTPRNPGNLKL